jgi:hypothetical protein
MPQFLCECWIEEAICLQPAAKPQIFSIPVRSWFLIQKQIHPMETHFPFYRPDRLGPLALTLLTLTICAHATITDVAWYRLGEIDPGAASGQLVPQTTRDLLGVNPLNSSGSPIYSDQVSPVAANRLGSSLAVMFNGFNQLSSDSVVTAARNNFGIEAWVAPSAFSGVPGTHLIAHNGDPMANGWGLMVETDGAGTAIYHGEYGGSIMIGAGFGRAAAWTHVALVCDNGTSTLYVNGVASGSSSLPPDSPAGGFTIASSRQLFFGGLFMGAIDEVRVFTFAPGQFSTADLLVNQQFPVTQPPSSITPAAATLNGQANSFGLPTTAWFEWGTSTNFGSVTAPQDLGNSFIITNFSALITGFNVNLDCHFRAVVSNSLGVLAGADQTFSLKPAVATLPAVVQSATTASLNGTADSKGIATFSVWFEWGLTTNYGNLTRPQRLDHGLSGTNFSEVVSNLFPGGTFHCRAAASDGVTILTGLDQSFATPADPFADRAIPGNITVTIQPPEAVADGASWSVDGGPAQPPAIPGAPTAPGHHTVRFGNLTNWRPPPPVEVFVIGGKTVPVAAEFTRLPTYDFRDVPEQQVRHGEPLAFFVKGASNVLLQVSAAPTPAGELTFDPASGRFTYTPAAADRLPFTLTFSTGGAETATSIVTPLSDLPSEETTINYNRPLPDEESRDYITISQSLHPAELFNDATHETLTVDISGKTLVFDASHPSNLYPEYNGRENIRELRLFADRVIIRSPLLLPQTHVSIHARELRFEGDGLIDTTPQARRQQQPGVGWEDDRTAGYDGDPGHDGGDADVFVERFHADPTPAIRFVLRGGNGGPAGEGRDGKFEGDGTFSPMMEDANWIRLMTRAGNHICGIGNNHPMLYTQNILEGSPQPPCGSQVPAYGEPAVPSGVPGSGGRGGTLRSTVDLSSYALQTGGIPGSPGGNHVGGTLFFTYIYRVTTFRTVRGKLTVINDDTTAERWPGADAPAPIGSQGQVGANIIMDASAWLHSFIVRSVVQYAKDAYLDGHDTEARALLSDYLGYIETLPPAVASVTNLSDEEFAETTSLDQLTLELGTLLHRIDANLDFFGNPAGWVPMLSFEANLLAFQHEIDQSIPILYLAYWLNHSATNLQDTLAASGVAVGKLKAELDDMIAAYNEAQRAIPRLKVESDAVLTRISAVQIHLSLLEQELLARAEQNVEDRHKVPFWKKALGVLSVVADLVPVGQPTLGKIGAGLGLLAKIDPDHPLQSARSLTNAFDVFSKNVDIRVCFNNSTTNATNNAGSATSPAKKDQLKALTECAKFLKSELKEVGVAFKEVQVDSKEVQAELEKIKASDEEFNLATAELEQLNKDKERFAQELAAALQTVSKFASSMVENTLATDALENQIANALSVLDHNALLHIKEMERRAKDRLLTFQYYVAKSFQYRVLQPYSGNLHLNRLFDRFRVLIEAGNSHILGQQDFENLKTLYLAELRDTVAQTLTSLNANSPQHSLPVQLELVGADLQKLNREGQLTVNLRQRGLFPSSHENIRIVDWRTHALTAHPVNGTVGSFALLFLDYEHRGISRLTSSGQTYLFRHYQTEAVNPVTWNTVFDGVANRFSNSQLSPAAQSLLANLLDQPTADKLLLFSYPAADADILIRKAVQTDNGIDLAIDSLVIEVEYEFASVNSARPQLDVVVTDDLQPMIAVSQMDINGRRDGQGDFRRVFPSGAMVTLETAANYGGRPFDRWVINHQPRAAGLTVVTLAMTTSMTAEAWYGPLPGSGIAPQITQQPQDASSTLGSTASFTVAASGTAPLTFQWQKGSTLLIDGGRIAGATTPILVITNLGLSDAAAYSVTLGNSLGSLTSRSALLTVTGPSVLPAVAPAGSVGFLFPTLSGLTYTIEYKSRLDDPAWMPVDVIRGTGGLMQFTRPTTSGSSFFRLRVE